MMTAECFKTQAMIDFVIEYINKHKESAKMSNKFLTDLMRSIGVQLEALFQPSRMPTLALAEAMVCEPSHCLLGV